MRSSLSGRVGPMIPVSRRVLAVCSLSVTRPITFTSRKPKSWRHYPALDERMYVRGPARVQEHVALADAGLGLQQAVVEQRFADRLGELAVVAGESAREVRELRVVAAPLPHAVEPLQDAPRDAPRRVGVVVRARG